MSKYDETFCRKCSAVPIKPSPSSSSSSSSTSTRYRSFNVSKVFSICGILLLTFGYDFNWISSTLVAADKHTYGSIDSNGLCLPRFFLLPLHLSLLSLYYFLLCHFFPSFVIQFIKPKPFHINLKIKQRIFPDEVILHRRIIERTSSVPTNYTIIYKYVRNRMGGQISYIEFDVANCVSNRLAFDCRHAIHVGYNLHHTERVCSTCTRLCSICVCVRMWFYVWWKLIFTGEQGNCSNESHRWWATWRTGC